jgi:hypothetical protein
VRGGGRGWDGERREGQGCTMSLVSALRAEGSPVRQLSVRLMCRKRCIIPTSGQRRTSLFPVKLMVWGGGDHGGRRVSQEGKVRFSPQDFEDDTQTSMGGGLHETHCNKSETVSCYLRNFGR